MAKKMAIELDLPTIIISSQVPKLVDFISKINEIEQDCCIFIDEFEKLFSRPDTGRNEDYHDQNSFLSFMDGAITSKFKRIFILTTNEDLSQHFINRPSRIRYYKNYEFIDPELYDAIIADKLKDKDFEKDLRDNLPLFDCTIDLINTIIEEINIHGKPYSSFKEFFNHRNRSIPYYKSIHDGKEWKHVGLIDMDKPVERSTISIDDQWNCKVTDIKDKYVFYNVKQAVNKRTGLPMDDDDLDDDDYETRTVRYRLEMVNDKP